MISSAATGFFTAFSLILAIGAQNAFVLRQGVLRQHVFALCLLCAVSDAILITLGVAGFGWLVSLNPRFPDIMAIGGAVFLIAYGATRFWAAYRGSHDIGGVKGAGAGLYPTLLTGLALTWLNPHVYLDTLGLIGAVSSQYSAPVEKLAFGLAAISASFVFFFSLGYGARYLAPIMQTVRAWRIFDTLIGLVMWMIAAGLLASL
jgi:L-lysine exporter family protein LysE/ArgO